MSDSQEHNPERPAEGASPRRRGGPQKVDRTQFLQQLSQQLFGEKERGMLTIKFQIRGEHVDQFLGAFLNYTDACKAADPVQKPDLEKFMALALEPGLRQVFKYATADAEAALLNGEQYLGKEAFVAKRSRAPKGNPVT